jgi:hypothetical protein
MKIITKNWKRISKVIIEVGSKIFWNDPTCKDKWEAIYGDFKKFMITWVVSSIMKNIGTSTPKTNLTWDCQNNSPNYISSLIYL